MAKDTRNIEKVAEDALRRGLTNQEALEEVLRIHLTAKTSIKSIMWYRNRLRSNGENVLMARELKEVVSSDQQADTGQPLAPTKALSGSHLDVVRASLRDWKTNLQALEAAQTAFPNAKVNLRDVSSVRTRLRDKNERIPTDNEARRRQEGRPWASDLAPTK